MINEFICMSEKSCDLMNILSIEEAQKASFGLPSIIITGATGQDGSLMADYLLKNTNYMIFGGARRLSVSNHVNIDHLNNNKRFKLINLDLTDDHSISQTINKIKPLYFINFGAQSFVKSSWDFPAQTWDVNTKSIIHILEAIRLHCPTCRFYNAGSSEEFGNVSYSPQDETHPLKPRSPYGASKAAARQLVKVYRDSYGLYAVQGWLFNHEGTRRGEEFVTRKITKGVANIVKEISQNIPITPIELGNLDAKRDWSDAEDCVDAVWRMLNQDSYSNKCSTKDINYLTDIKYISKHIKDYVVSSDHSHSIREFIEKAFYYANIKGSWIKPTDNLSEMFITTKYCINPEKNILIKINPSYYRPAEVDNLLGNSTAIRTELGWSPKTSFDQLVEKMVSNDIK